MNIMKKYGANKATEFTKKQIGVIYGKAKSGQLRVEKWVASEMYDLADYYGYDDNRTVEDLEGKILRILDAVFEGNLERAQELIDTYTESSWELMSAKYQRKANRGLVA